jgi:hypothetical protein
MGWAGFEDTNMYVWVFCKSGGYNEAGSSATNDNKIIVNLIGCLSCASFDGSYSYLEKVIDRDQTRNAKF